jgi:hypothetical protein
MLQNGQGRQLEKAVAACLIAIARARLVPAGLIPAAMASRLLEPERQLYPLLRQEGGDAYSRYNARLRERVSFESALDRRMGGGMVCGPFCPWAEATRLPSQGRSATAKPDTQY